MEEVLRSGLGGSCRDERPGVCTPSMLGHEVGGHVSRRTKSRDRVFTHEFLTFVYYRKRVLCWAPDVVRDVTRSSVMGHLVHSPFTHSPSTRDVFFEGCGTRYRHEDQSIVDGILGEDGLSGNVVLRLTGRRAEGGHRREDPETEHRETDCE